MIYVRQRKHHFNNLFCFNSLKNIKKINRNLPFLIPPLVKKEVILALKPSGYAPFILPSGLVLTVANLRHWVCLWTSFLARLFVLGWEGICVRCRNTICSIVYCSLSYFGVRMRDKDCSKMPLYCRWRAGENPIEMSGSDLCISRNETVRYFQNNAIMFCLPISTIMYQWAIFIFPGSVCQYLLQPNRQTDAGNI